MLCYAFFRTEERGRLKCGHYWPACDSTQEQYGEFVVRNNSVHRLENYTETKLTVCNTDVGILLQEHYVRVCAPVYMFCHH